MRHPLRRLLLPALLLGLAAPCTPAAVPAQAQTQPLLRWGSTTLTSVADWQAGTSDGLLISNNEAGPAGGELRLSDERQQAVFTSDPFSTTLMLPGTAIVSSTARVSSTSAVTETAPVSGTAVATSTAAPVSAAPTFFTVNAVGATWQADIPADTSLALEVRGAPTVDGPWSAWQPLVAGDARSPDDGSFASESLRALPLGTALLQLRVSFKSEVQRASATMRGLTVFYYDSLAGPASAFGLPSVPLAYGPSVLTPRPSLVLRSDWSRDSSAITATLAAPRSIVVHQTGTLGSSEVLTTTGQPLMVLRALADYQGRALGWGDMIYHYIIDRDGNLYEGRRNGPASVVTQLGLDEPAVHIALISDTGEEPTAEARKTLAKLVGWLGQAYDLPPLGEHLVKLTDGSILSRRNLVAHSEAVPAAADPGDALRALMPELRREADSATVRARYYFAEGNTRDFEMRIALFNASAVSTTVNVSLLRQGQEPLIKEVPLDAGRRSDVVVNDLARDAGDAAVIVEASQPVVAERVLRRTTSVNGAEVSEVAGNVGIPQLSKVWYFAEGSTDKNFETYLALLNPEGKAVNATLTYMLGDSKVVTQTVQIPPRSRSVVRASEKVPGVGFGVRVFASQPIAAERTMIFGSNKQGFHTSPGQVALARRWLFAEGTTQNGIAMRVLLLNPGSLPAEAELTFATPDGTSLRRKYALPPTSRIVVNVNDVVPDLGVAVQVEANRPIMAERALYFNEGNAGTASVGTTQPAYSWRFAEGRTDANNQMFLLVSNPGKGQARVSVEALLADGSVRSEGFLMPGNSRYTFAAHEIFPGQGSLAVTVRATQPVVVERSLFRDGGRGGGYTTLGVSS